MVDDVAAVLLLDALDERGGVVVLVGLYAVDFVQAGFVECDGIGGSQDADVLHLGRLGMGVAVAVDADVVHHVDVDDVALAHILLNGIGGSGHRFEEGVLGLGVLPALGRLVRHAVTVDVGLAGGGGHADALVLQHAAEAAHHMTLEVGQVDHEAVVLELLAHDVVFDPRGVAHGDAHILFLVHQHHLGDGVEAVGVNGLPMLALVLAGTAVGRAALHNGAVDFIDKLADEGGLEVVVAAHLARADFHGHASVGLHTELLVDLDQTFGRNFFGEIHGGGLLLGTGRQYQSKKAAQAKC